MRSWAATVARGRPYNKDLDVSTLLNFIPQANLVTEQSDASDSEDSFESEVDDKSSIKDNNTKPSTPNKPTSHALGLQSVSLFTRRV
jgi:hypothetical protein